MTNMHLGIHHIKVVTTELKLFNEGSGPDFWRRRIHVQTKDGAFELDLYGDSPGVLVVREEEA